MFEKVVPVIILLSIGLLISCSENPTSSGPDTEPPNQNNPEVTTGTLEVLTATQGNGTDDDGYTITLDGGDSQPIGTDETITYTEIEEGTYSVEITGLDSGCSVEGDNPISADIVAEETSTLRFDITCEESTAEGTIAFSQRVGGVFEIFTVEADGTSKQQITDNGAEQSGVDISPDGTRIVFARQDIATTKYDIWVMNIDGSSQTQITTNEYNDRHPSWSPDGSKIAFETTRDGNFNIYVMNADGSDQTPLTTDEAQDLQADWSPAGDRIAFISDPDGDGTTDIFTVKSDGTGREKLVEATDDNGINLFNPAWSPDGLEIAYQGYSDNGAARIFIADDEGNNARIITSDSFSARQPAWSPDGQYLSFTDLSGGSSSDAIWTIRTDGELPIRLTSDEDTYSGFPSWGPTTESSGQ